MDGRQKLFGFLHRKCRRNTPTRWVFEEFADQSGRCLGVFVVESCSIRAKNIIPSYTIWNVIPEIRTKLLGVVDLVSPKNETQCCKWSELGKCAFFAHQSLNKRATDVLCEFSLGRARNKSLVAKGMTFSIDQQKRDSEFEINFFVWHHRCYYSASNVFFGDLTSNYSDWLVLLFRKNWEQ